MLLVGPHNLSLTLIKVSLINHILWLFDEPSVYQKVPKCLCCLNLNTDRIQVLDFVHPPSTLRTPAMDHECGESWKQFETHVHEHESSRLYFITVWRYYVPRKYLSVVNTLSLNTNSVIWISEADGWFENNILVRGSWTSSIFLVLAETTLKLNEKKNLLIFLSKSQVWQKCHSG